MSHQSYQTTYLRSFYCTQSLWSNSVCGVLNQCTLSPSALWLFVWSCALCFHTFCCPFCSVCSSYCLVVSMGSFALVCSLLLAPCWALVHVYSLSPDCSDPVSFDLFQFGRCPRRFTRCGNTTSFPVSSTSAFFFVLLVFMFCVESFSAPPCCSTDHVEWLSPSDVTCF